MAPPSGAVKAFVGYKGMIAAGIIAMHENGFDRSVTAGLQAVFRKTQELSAK